MGHTGTGPVGSSNSPHCHKDLGLPRLPEVSEHQQEMWLVPKDTIYAARTAIEKALGYMPKIKTDVPQWRMTVEQDVMRMQCALSELRKLSGGFASEASEFATEKNPVVSGSHKTAKEVSHNAGPEHSVTVVCGEDGETAVYLNGKLQDRRDTNDAYEIARVTKSHPCIVETRNPDGWQCGKNWPELLKDVPLYGCDLCLHCGKRMA